MNLGEIAVGFHTRSQHSCGSAAFCRADYRIAQDGTILRTGPIMDTHTGYRIAEDGEIMKTSVGLDESSGYRIDEDGRIFEINGDLLLFDKDSGLRVDADGSLNQRSALGETRVRWTQVQGVESGSTESGIGESSESPSTTTGAPDYGRGLTTEGLQELESSQRKAYAKDLVIVCIVTFWVILFDGYKFIAVLIVFPMLFKVWGDMPSFQSIRTISIDKYKGDNLIAYFLRSVAGWAPFVVLTYLLLKH